MSNKFSIIIDKKQSFTVTFEDESLAQSIRDMSEFFNFVRYPITIAICKQISQAEKIGGQLLKFSELHPEYKLWSLDVDESKMNFITATFVSDIPCDVREELGNMLISK